MKIAVIGTGYVGLVTGVCLADIGHQVTCIDIDDSKIEALNSGKSIIFEPGLEELMEKNCAEHRLRFTSEYKDGLENADVIYIAVGTPANEDGTANLKALENVAVTLATYIKKHVIIVTKSTVPIGTNDKIRQWVENNLTCTATFDIVSNPEFLREGSAIQDTFYGDRIIIGSDSVKAGDIIEEINSPFNIPVFRTSVRSAEMIKYASNAFLATKISFINEISNLCEELGADVTEVAHGMGMDKRIGPHFLDAGIGYGGSCFPKDTNALMQIAGDIDMDFELLKSVIKVNKKQNQLLIKKAQKRLGDLHGLRIAVLGLAFKPNTDDVREAASLTIIKELLSRGAQVIAYDPVAEANAKLLLPVEVEYAGSISSAIKNADSVFILTEWQEIVDFDPSFYELLMKRPIVFDGRNCYKQDQLINLNIEYYSIGRPNFNAASFTSTGI
ncbi:MAG: UDP-glucose/GDP-mannose dehydrogenase family protein [Paenibacillus sp.]|uniref:UDP-glucose dehydrogenase family protein n=1 Tax=Paenibacillus sp. TaxID=58172 RepID=UPI0025D108B5|nr:UDP-glucose/GDP-mannose dehydrogenase family protein [Paenibacillus sp.]MBR2566710.1 UDP-glucose/GDP-mannose dehydrogenase family protein [Paenibacillus sp.]